MLQSKAVLFLSALTLAGSTFAGPQPDACPSVAAIKEGGLIGVVPYLTKRYMVFSTSNYNTSNNWGFFMGALNAKADGEALDMGKQLLTTLAGNPVPEKNHNDWMCVYQLADPKVMAVAYAYENKPFSFEGIYNLF